MVAALMSGRIAAFEIDKYSADYLFSRTKQYAVFSLPKASVYSVKFSMPPARGGRRILRSYLISNQGHESRRDTFGHEEEIY